MINRKVLVIAGLLFMPGCITYTIQLKPEMSGVKVPGQRTMSVAVIQGESLKAEFQKPLGGAVMTYNMSEALRAVSQEAYAKVFRHVVSLAAPPAAGEYDLVIAQDILDFQHTFQCAGFSCQSSTARLTLRIKLLSKGEEIWTKDYRSPEVRGPGWSVSTDDLLKSYEVAAGGALVAAVKSSAEGFHKDQKLARLVRSLDKFYLEQQRKIADRLQRENATFRVVAADARVRQSPDADAYEIDSYPMGSVVHVIGRLDDGWLQVARDGKPFGWVYEASLRAEGNVGGGGGGASTADKKPTIYVAYPKGNEKVAEDAIEFIGYVSSENRTDRLEVLVNNRRVRVDRLWSEFKVAPKGLRGYPIRWRVPLNPGRNKINVNVLDQEGFLVNKAVIVERIEIAETPAPATTSMADLPPPLGDLAVAQQAVDVNTENFMSILGDWVKETAKSDYNKGNTMFDQGRFARAAYYYKKSVKTEPLAQAWFNLGVSEKALGNETKASEAFATACKMNVPQACNVAS